MNGLHGEDPSVAKIEALTEERDRLRSALADVARYFGRADCEEKDLAEQRAARVLGDDVTHHHQAWQRVMVRIGDGSGRYDPAHVEEVTSGDGYMVRWDCEEWGDAPFWVPVSHVRSSDRGQWRRDVLEAIRADGAEEIA